MAELGIEPIARVPVQHLLLPSLAQAGGLQQSWRKQKAGSAFGLCLWALGTRWLFQVQKRVPTMLGSLGYSHAAAGAKRGRREQAEEQARTEMHKALSSACKRSASSVHVLNLHSAVCRVQHSLCCCSLQGSSPSAAVWSPGGAHHMHFRAAPFSQGVQHCLTLPVLLSVPAGLKTPSNCELVVGGEPQCWAEGRCLLFDDSFLHTAFHEGQCSAGPRLTPTTAPGSRASRGNSVTCAQTLLLPRHLQGWWQLHPWGDTAAALSWHRGWCGGAHSP